MESNISNSSGPQSRRTFIIYSLFASFLVFTGGVIYSIFRYLSPIERRGLSAKSDFLSIPLENMEVGSSQTLRFRGKPIIVIRTDSNKVSALSAVCTHLGCIVKWYNDKNQLICPCHAARFDLFGNVLSGPAPKPLPAFSARIEGDKIVVL